jgi:hypothetical protein
MKKILFGLVFRLCTRIRETAAFHWVSINGTIRVPRLVRPEADVCWAFQRFLECIGGNENCSTGPSHWHAGFRNRLERYSGF